MRTHDRILITGSSGMLGRSLSRLLASKGFNNLLLPTSVELNLLEQHSVQDYLKHSDVDYVIHLAGTIGGIADSISRPVEFMYDNLTMAMNIIKCSSEAGIANLLFIGSSCIYPLNCPQPMMEKHLLTGPLEPTNEGYSLAKIAGIKLCEYLNKQYRFNYFCLMPPNLYGFNDSLDLEKSHVLSALISKFHFAKANNQRFVEVWGSGKSKREFLFVDDFSNAILHFLYSFNPHEHGTFINVGSGKAISIADLAHLIKNIIGYDGNIVFNKDKPDGMPQKLMDSSVAKKMGWQSKIDLSEGIKMTYDWFKLEIKNKV